MMRFTLPRDMYYGKGALEDLKKLQGKKAIVVSGGHSMRKGGFLDRVEAYLKEAGMEVKFFEGVEPDPAVGPVIQGAHAMTGSLPSAVVLRSMPQRQCGHSMSTRIRPLKILSFRSTSRS